MTFRNHALYALALMIIALLVCSSSSAQTGYPSYGSFQGTNIDTVNLQNLNVHVSIPIVQSDGRGSGFAAQLTQDTLSGYFSWGLPFSVLGVGQVAWSASNSPCDGYGGYDPDSGAAVGEWYTEYYNFTYTDSAGTVHPYSIDFFDYTSAPHCGTGFGGYGDYSTDGSGIYLDGGTHFVTFPNGAKDEIQAANKLIDANGNIISRSYNVSTHTWTWTDSVGHVILSDNHIYCTGTCTDQIKVLAPDGSYQTISVLWQAFAIWSNSACPMGSYNTTLSLPYEIDLPNGKKYTISYEPSPGHSGYVTQEIGKVTLPMGGYYQYSYTCSSGQITGLTRTLNDGTSSATWQYSRAQSGANWLTTVTAPQLPYDSTGNQTVYTFNSTGQQTNQQAYQGSAATGTLLQTKSTTWASNNSPATTITTLADSGQQSEVDTTFDSYGNLTQSKEYDWGSGGHGSLIREIDLSYVTPAAFRLAEKLIKDGSGAIKSREGRTYDDFALVSVTGAAQHDDSNYGSTYTARGNLTTITTYKDPATPSGGVSRTFTYDTLGNVRTASIAGVQQQSLSYSSTTNYSFPDSVTNGPSAGPQLTVSATYNGYTGQTVTSTDVNGQTTTYAYDIMRRLVTTTRPDGTQIGTCYSDLSTSACYSTTSNYTISTTPVDSSHARKVYSYYDGLSQVVRTSLYDSSGTTNYSNIDTQFDPLQRPYKRSNPYASSASYWTQSNFDGLGRRIKDILPDGSYVVSTYYGNCVTKTDQAGKARKACSDASNHTTAVYEDPTGLDYETDYQFDPVDHLTKVTQGSQTRTMSFDGLGNLNSTTTPEAGTVCFGTVSSGSCQNNGYDSFGNLTTKTDARGVVTTFSYDTLNRLYQTTYNVGSTGVANPGTISYTYGTSSSSYNNDRIVSVAQGSVSDTYSYDLLGRVLQDQKSYYSQTYTVGYAYNADGSVTAITYPSGRVVDRNYDAIGRLCAIATSTGSCAPSSYYATSLAYNAAQQLTGLTYGNGVAASYGFSADRLQLNSLSYSYGSTSLFSLTYAYGTSGTNNGQIASITDNADTGRSVSYTYDGLGRISTATTGGDSSYPAWGLQMTYDRYGNRTAQSISSGCTGIACPTNSLSVSSATNQISGTGFSYDANGNMTGDGLNSSTYDAENRNVTSSGYLYDPAGMRIYKCTGSCSTASVYTVYIYSNGRIIAEYDNGATPSAPSREYVYSDAALLATIDSSGTRYHHADHLSVRLTTNSSGSKIGEQGHFPFGEQWYASGTTTKFMFTNYERDSATGNDYAFARYNVNRLGRFSSLDPVTGSVPTPASWNPYSYSRNDSINMADPTGRDPNPQAYLGIAGYLHYAGGCSSTSVTCGAEIDEITDISENDEAKERLALGAEGALNIMIGFQKAEAAFEAIFFGFEDGEITGPLGFYELYQGLAQMGAGMWQMWGYETGNIEKAENEADSLTIAASFPAAALYKITKNTDLAVAAASVEGVFGFHPRALIQGTGLVNKVVQALDAGMSVADLVNYIKSLTQNH